MASIRLSPDDLKQVEELPAQAAPGNIKLSAADMQHVEDVPDRGHAIGLSGPGSKDPDAKVELAPTDGPQVSAAESFVRLAGAQVPFGRQAEAAFNTLPVVGTGKSYRENLSDVRNREVAAQQQHPTASDLGKGAGFAATLAGPAAAETALAKGAGLASKLAGPAVSSVQGGLQAGSDSKSETVGGKVVDALGGAATGASVGMAGPLAAKGAAKVAGKIGEAIGSTGRSDRRLLTKISTAAPKKLRDKLEQSEAEAISTIRSNPDLERAAPNPHTLKPAVENHLAKRAEQVDVHYAAADQALGPASPAELADRLRARQAELRKKLSTRDIADGMEAEIKKLEAHGSELHGDGGDITKPRPSPPGSFDELGEEVTFSPERRMAFQKEMREAHGRELHGITDAEAGGKVSATSEQATVAGGKQGPAKAAPESPVTPSEHPPGIDSRDLRQEITDWQEKAYSHAPWEKPGASHKAAKEIADVMRDALEERVGRVNPGALAEVKRLNQESSALAKLKAVAKYRDLNAPHELTTRLTAAMRNNRGVMATARAGVKYTFASADEALAKLARAAKKGPVPKDMLQAARDAGVKAATINFLTTKLGRNVDSDEETDSD